MSALLGAAPRRQPSASVRHLAALVAISFLPLLILVGAVSADRPTSVLELSPAGAARSGSAIGLIQRPVAASTLVEVVAPEAQPLLAVSADGEQAALADQVGQASGQLTLARGDGSQLRVPLPGIRSAGFAPDGSWVALVDGLGSLWRIDAASGRAAVIDEGPFIGSPIVAADGSVLLLSVSSVEAPYRSRVVAVAASTGVVTPLTSDELDYAAYPLADGGVAVVAHEARRTFVRSIGAAASEWQVDLEPGAVNVVVASDGRHVGYEIAGRGVVVLDLGTQGRRFLGPGSEPCFAGDASSLLGRRGAGSAVLGPDGSVLALTQQQAAFAGSAGCLS